MVESMIEREIAGARKQSFEEPQALSERSRPICRQIQWFESRLTGEKRCGVPIIAVADMVAEDACPCRLSNNDPSDRGDNRNLND